MLEYYSKTQVRIFHNATQFMSEIDGGGVVFAYYTGARIFEMFGTELNHDSSREYISTHPVSGYFLTALWAGPPFSWGVTSGGPPGGRSLSKDGTRAGSAKDFAV